MWIDRSMFGEIVTQSMLGLSDVKEATLGALNPVDEIRGGACGLANLVFLKVYSLNYDYEVGLLALFADFPSNTLQHMLQS